MPHSPVLSYPSPSSSIEPFVASSTALSMGGMNRRNKQADLARKMALAKKQRLNPDATLDDMDDDKNKENRGGLSDEEVKKQNDLKRFEDMLNSDASTVRTMDEFGGDSYLTKTQEEEEANAGYSRVERIYEGDPAPSAPFENLVSVKSGNPLGKFGAEKILPWVKHQANSQKAKDYVVVMTDPRTKSLELRQVMKTFVKRLPENILDRLLVVNADSPNDNRKFAKKNMVSSLNVYSDEKREWMREYTALGEKRWAICLFVLSEGRVQKLVREMDPDLAPTVVVNAVKSLS